MKINSNMTRLKTRLEDLKTAFSVGQKIIPVVGGLIDFIKETEPVLEEISNSINESAKRIPRVSSEINNITSANELATTEILDLVDKITNDVGMIEQHLKNGNSGKKKEIKEKLVKAAAGHAEISQLLMEYINLSDNGFPEDAVLKNVKNIKDDVYKITLSLQVQDITAQQLAAVKHLINSVQSSLTSLLVNFDSSDLTEQELKQIYESNSAYNPNARYHKSGEHQEFANSLINKGKSQTPQNEIDKLFE